MTKIALLADTHFGASKHSKQVHDYMSKSLAFMFDYLDINNIKTIIQLGDLFDVRKHVQFETIKWAQENFFTPIKDNDISLYVIAGNHDILYTNSSHINSVSLLCPDDTFVTDLEPETIIINGEKIDLFPWINANNIDASLKFLEESTSRYAVGHFEFEGFSLMPGTIAEKGMNHRLFSRYDRVYSGHFHTQSVRDRVLYTNILFQLSWSDWNDAKGFWILDTETGAEEYILNPHTLFEKISYVEGMEYDFANARDKYVKIIIVENPNQKKFDAFLANVNLNKPHDVKVLEASIVEAVAEAVGLTELVSTGEMISSVIDNMELDLDKIRLKSYVTELYAEAMALNNAL